MHMANQNNINLKCHNQVLQLMLELYVGSKIAKWAKGWQFDS
jgi:hypothetical protein